MTNPFREHSTKSVWYPDEQHEVGTVELVGEEPIPAEDVLHADARHGDYIEVKQNGITMWFSCPRDLSRALGEVEAEPGHIFQVRGTSREDEENAPWQYKVAHNPEQH